MINNFTLVDPQGWEWDLQSVYAAYMGHFQLHNIPWYDRSWGHLFSSFEEFIEFSWPVIVVTDAWTGRAHIVTRTNSIGAFLKMIKTRYGEVLPQVDNMLRISPFETSQRQLRTLSDWPSYKKLHATLPAAVLSAVKTRVRMGEPQAIQKLWEAKDKIFLAIDFEWSERNLSTCLEWGYAAMRCGHLDAIGIWPPVPAIHYRRGHYIVADYVDKIHNKHCPTYPWEYAFGDSQVVPKAKLPEIIQALISSLVSPESETTVNNLVLVAHGISGDLDRLNDMKIKIPSNVLILDTSSFERQLFSTGHRSIMADAKTGKPRAPGSTLSLRNMLLSMNVDVHCTLHNSGNDAYMCLLGLQKLLESDTVAPTIKPRDRTISKDGRVANLSTVSRNPAPTLQLPTQSLPGMDGNRASFYSTTSRGPSAHALTPSPRNSPQERKETSTSSYFVGASQPSTKPSAWKTDSRVEKGPNGFLEQQNMASGRNSRRVSLNAEALLDRSVENMTLR